MISLISIILEIGYLNIIRPDSYLLPLFTLVSLIFLKKDNHYFIKCFLIGILYDLVFTNLFIINGILYLFIGFIIKRINNSIIKNIITGILIIFLYQLLLFILFNISKYQIYSLNEFIYILPKYFIINIIYILIISIFKHKYY